MVADVCPMTYEMDANGDVNDASDTFVVAPVGPTFTPTSTPTVTPTPTITPTPTLTSTPTRHPARDSHADAHANSLTDHDRNGDSDDGPGRCFHESPPRLRHRPV